MKSSRTSGGSSGFGAFGALAFFAGFAFAAGLAPAEVFGLGLGFAATFPRAASAAIGLVES
ncbi:hypothetical protein GCM10007036_03390 [Alsobacter metallidurans]|uniref:Uncharacterized protein n=1 Tax=Alsobacter metallidurans TaxID=340221 RepID=A0A917I382_9HYPH|nr:hypothetical protein GCM10007036_03390 [Alsobacter metallidurans]